MAEYQAGVADHGEHHRCARCEAVGRAEAEARLATHEITVAALAEAGARLAALTAALARYGQHERDCDDGRGAPCDCGYQAALDAARGATE